MTISASGITSSTGGAPLRSPDLHNITIKYLEKHLTPQDIQFINMRGLNGKPDWGLDLSGYKRTVAQSALFQEATGTLLRSLYADPSNRSAPITAAYYSTPVRDQNESAIQSLNFMLTHGSLDDTTKASLRQTITTLQTIKTDQIQRYQWQMTRLLDDFNGVLEHRGVADEAHIIGVIDDINAVKRNIASFKSPDTSEGSARFFEIYTEAIKQKCEFLIAQGRNPFHLDDAFMKNVHAGQPLGLAWQNAMEAERPRVRAIADQLKELLGPFTQISPTSRDRSRGNTQNANQAPRQHLGDWDLV
jgi:hypothetical protein